MTTAVLRAGLGARSRPVGPHGRRSAKSLRPACGREGPIGAGIRLVLAAAGRAGGGGGGISALGPIDSGHGGGLHSGGQWGPGRRRPGRVRVLVGRRLPRGVQSPPPADGRGGAQALVEPRRAPGGHPGPDQIGADAVGRFSAHRATGKCGQWRAGEPGGLLDPGPCGRGRAGQQQWGAGRLAYPGGASAIGRRPARRVGASQCVPPGAYRRRHV